MSRYKCPLCGAEFNMNKPTNFALALEQHHCCPEYEYKHDDDGILVEKIPPSQVNGTD